MVLLQSLKNTNFATKPIYLYCAIDSEGNKIDFYLRSKRDAKAAKRFLKKALIFCYATGPRSILVDVDKAYPVTIRELKGKQRIPHGMPLCVKKIFKQHH